MRRRFSAVVFAIFWATSLSQVRCESGSADDEQLFLRSGQKQASDPLNAFFGAAPSIYKVDENGNSQYFFLPQALMRFDALKSSFDAGCPVGSDLGKSTRIRSPVIFYTDEMFAEIKEEILRKNSSLNFSQISVGVADTSGIVMFASDEKDNKIEVLSTVPSFDEKLLAGARMLPTTPPNNFGTDFVATCAEVKSIIDRRKFEALLLTTGTRAQTNGASIATLILNDRRFKADLDNTESAVDKTISTQSGGGAGFSIHIGPFGGGGSTSTNTVTNENIKYRIINREWLGSEVNRLLHSVEISTACDRGACDDPSGIEKIIIDNVFKSFQEENVEIRKEGERWIARTASKGDIPLEQITISDEVKSILDSSQNLQDEKEGEYSGVKAKKKEGYIYTNNGEIGWKQSGSQWVPTTMKAHIYDTSEVDGQLKASYSATIYGNATRVALPLDVILLDPAVQDPSVDTIARIRQKLIDYFQAHPVPPPPVPMTQYKDDQRKLDAVYLNNSPSTLRVIVTRVTPLGAWCHLQMLIDGALNSEIDLNLVSDSSECTVGGFVPPGSSYKIQALPNTAHFPGQTLNWFEIVR